MPGPEATRIELSEKAQAGLEQLVKSHSTEQQIAKRAQIILHAAAGKDSGVISQEVGVSRKTVFNWRERWLGLAAIPLSEFTVKERLEDLPRPGAPARITADQRCQLEALACEAPAQSGRPISEWSGREIADELIKRNIVETISPRHAARLLKRCLYSAPSEPLLAQYAQR
ncbi:MAG: helix-turn-helix domain-containing protein [Caldilineaceae bacterium]|nr:helix-turn-helix domain-containing protein [Caldilineaceae bacterium]